MRSSKNSERKRGKSTVGLKMGKNHSKPNPTYKMNARGGDHLILTISKPKEQEKLGLKALGSFQEVGS